MSAQTEINQNESTSRTYTRLEWLAFGLFWSWNLIFLAFMSLGFAPTMLPELFTGVRTGAIPASFLVYALVLALVPVIAVILGLTVLRRSPARLFALGYVVEGPLMLLLAVRFFVIREATPGVTVLLAISFLGMAAFLWDLLNPAGKRLLWLRLVGLTLMAMVAIYAAVWIAFYALPLGAAIGEWLQQSFGNLWFVYLNLRQDLIRMVRDTPYMIGFSVIGFFLLAYTATLFVLAPIAVPVLSLRAWWRSLSGYAGRDGWFRPALLVSATIVVCAGMFVWANQQPQARAFALLEKPPASPAEAQSLLKRSQSIRRGLLNAYLAPFRYMSASGEVRHITDLYEISMKMSPQEAYKVQGMYEAVASPLIYAPVHRLSPAISEQQQALVDEPQEAAKLYQQFFDTPITQGEKATIVGAVRSTWSMDQAEAAWQAVDDREVHLVSQDVNVMPHGDYADLELHEAYQNQTAQQQEVIYYFSLPESAVITGLWLGNSPDKAQAFTYQVAPRGAAQAVYREETRVFHDPALVEQIGPRQYRLRAYPVPPLRTDYNQNTGRTTVGEAPELHLWLSWREMAGRNPAAADGEASWPLPQLAEGRNVYWDDDTERSANGKSMDVSADEWLPVALTAGEPLAPTAHRYDLANGQTVLAIPADQAQIPALPESLRLAVVLDRSRSMESVAPEVSAALETIRQAAGAQPVDVYLTASPFRGEDPSMTTLDQLDMDSMVYYGGQNSAALLSQFEKLKGDRSYDAALVLTDNSGYELGSGWVELSPLSMPVWLVHLGGKFPLGYDDQTHDAVLASGGGVAGDIGSALARLAVARSNPISAADSPTTDLLDSYLWLTLPAEKVESVIPAGMEVVNHGQGDPFAALAARRVILAEMQRMHAYLDQLANLDELNALAVENSIVTPYSSMIVLVNNNQQILLDKLSQNDDRFQREVEAVGDTQPRSSIPLTGVPEPHEWLLLGLAAAFLVYVAYTKYAKGIRLA